MVPKYVCAAVLAAGFVMQGHAANSRDAPVYKKVNRDSEYGAPEAPASSYSAPASSYEAPATAYSAPATSYNAPAATYGAPAPAYGAPAPSYGVAYEEDTKFPDITFIIVGILIVTGLALLFPTYVSLSTVRRKRDVTEEGKSCFKAQLTYQQPRPALDLPSIWVLINFFCSTALSFSAAYTTLS